MFSKLALVLALFVAAPALAQKVVRTNAESQALTGSAPTAAGDGLGLDALEGFHVTVSAPSGQTISGGTLLCYYFEVALSRWARCSSAFDLTPQTGQRDWTSPDVEVLVGGGRVKFIPSSITLSGAGTSVSTFITGRKK